MKRTIACLLISMLAFAAWSVPAKPGLWKTIRLTDGTEVRARLCGDEHAHFWMTASGKSYVNRAGTDVFMPISREQIQKRAFKHRPAVRKNQSRLMSPRKVAIGERTHYIGTKKGLVILVEFSDLAFRAANNLERFKRIMNEEGYNEGKFKGSVSDYFKAQSAGQFELDFDVVGPYTMSHDYKYYGQNDSDGNDMHAEDMIIEACKEADNDVNFADYDWDGDGEAEEVFVLYAGKGEADGGNTNTIWPHMYFLSETGMSLTLDNTKIDTYACSNEIMPDGRIEGIGCFCHEFSHCMGFPDFYDVSYSGWFGMSDFDLMCGGSYNGDTYRPAGYTAHEKMMCGWQEPTVLAEKDTVITNMMPMSNNGETFIIYNDAYPDEYFTIENRQKTGWDTDFPAKGLMITHVDFDQDLWKNNFPNTEITLSSDIYAACKILNDHQRMTIIHADNDDDSTYWHPEGGYYSKKTLSTDLYPYKQLDSLTVSSTPAPTLYNENSQGTKTVDWAILDMKQNDDGTMDFRYRAKTPYVITPDDDPSGILTLSDKKNSSCYYSLDGRRINGKPSTKGIYIYEGRKVAIKF